MKFVGGFMVEESWMVFSELCRHDTGPSAESDVVLLYNYNVRG